MLIDVQNAFLDSKWGKRNNPNAEQKMLRLLQHFRAKRQKIIHIQHISDNPNSLFYQGEAQAFQAGFEPQNDEVVFQKKVNSAFLYWYSFVGLFEKPRRYGASHCGFNFTALHFYNDPNGS